MVCLQAEFREIGLWFDHASGEDGTFMHAQAREVAWDM